jgi:hypothetical protein
MPTALSEPAEELIRQFFTDNIVPSNVEGYDPRETDPQQTDFLPVVTDWSFRGDYYPVISVLETDSPVIPNSGNTTYNGVQGDGSGPNQMNVKFVTVSCQAVQSKDGDGAKYRNGKEANALVKSLYDECHRLIQNNSTTAVSEALPVGMTPPTTTRSNEETDSGSTITWIQRQGTVNIPVINTP